MAVARTAVLRDGFTREVEHVSEPERPVRLYLTLKTLLRGLMMVGLEEPEALSIACKAGLDSIPPVRLHVIRKLVQATEPLEIKDIIGGFSETTVRRALEELEFYAVLTHSGEKSTPFFYSISDWTARKSCLLPELTVPDISALVLEKRE